MGKTVQILSPGKKTLLVCLILMATSSILWGGIPSGYYDSASGKSGTALKSALHAIISDHTKKTYTQAWDIIKEADEDPNNSGNVILLYSGRSQEKEYRDHGSSWDYTQYDNGDGLYNDSWNREHVWAKSHGFPSESDTAYTDCHHLRPVDRSVNSSRNNLDFDNGGSAHSEATDCNYDSDSWEPRDAVKGDVARMIFYMAVRYDPGYHSDDSEYDLEIVDSTGMDLGVAPGRPVIGKLSTLLAWHTADPVDAFEQNRNEVVYGYQGNRNPFIDHPSYVNSIWDSQQAASNDLIITGVYDGPLTGGVPKGIELYASVNIADLSIYGVGSANNGGGSDGQEFTFPAVVVGAGTYLYLASESDQFNAWFGFAPDYASSAANINGDDAIELFCNGNVVDVYGDINADGSGAVWDYLDGWAYSKDGRSINVSFTSGDWSYSGINALDGETTNSMAGTKIPVGTFKSNDASLPVELSSWKASSSNGHAKLTWSTYSEIENQGFIIERRNNTSSFEGTPGYDQRLQPGEEDEVFAWKEIASFIENPGLMGQGSTTSQHDYTFIDKRVNVGQIYNYRLADVDYGGRVNYHADIKVTIKDAGVDLKPSHVQLHKAFPNPFNPDVNISFTLENEVENLSLEIYDIKGALIVTLSSGFQDAGVHDYIWQGFDHHNHAVTSGIYLVRLRAGSISEIQRVTLLR